MLTQQNSRDAQRSFLRNTNRCLWCLKYFFIFQRVAIFCDFGLVTFKNFFFISSLKLFTEMTIKTCKPVKSHSTRYLWNSQISLESGLHLEGYLLSRWTYISYAQLENGQPQGSGWPGSPSGSLLLVENVNRSHDLENTLQVKMAFFPQCSQPHRELIPFYYVQSHF